MNDLKKIVIEAFVDAEGNIHAGRITYPTNGAETQKTPSTESKGVKLNPKAPDFEAKKKTLKEKGYTFDRNTTTWFPPVNGSATESSSPQTQSVETDWFGDAKEISLTKDDPAFEAKKASLKAAGFTWRRDRKVWAR